MPMTDRSVPALSAHGFYKLAYHQWGGEANDRVLVCAHGLTRRGRDFDFLAQALESHYRVLCPDMPGRGLSDFLAVKEDYDYVTYVAAGAALIARAGVEKVDWVGTSMGGLIGMMLAAQPNSPIQRLVINDIGPFLPKAALERIGSYVGSDPRYDTLAELEQALRAISAPFGPLTDAQWKFLARHYARQLPDGKFTSHYDPGIAVNIRKSLPAQDVDLWPVWNQIKCPVLILRGKQSDLLTVETATKMLERPEPTKLVEFDGIGHAPALLAQDQIKVIKDWLLQ